MTTGKLPNGFSYYVHGVEGVVPANRVLLRLVVKAGSVLEDDDQRGVAHFVEHMAFAGTLHFQKNDINSLIRSLGMTLGPDANGETYPEITTYTLTVPVDAPATLGEALAFLRDVAENVRFEPAEVDRERQVLLEEWRASLSIDARLNAARWALPLTETPYVNHPTLGSPADVASTTVEALRRYYRDWYRPNLMAIVAIGALPPQLLVESISQLFGDLKSPAREKPATLPASRFNEDLLVNVVTDPEVSEPTVDFNARLDHGQPSTRAEFRTELKEGLVLSMLRTRLRYARAAHASFMAPSMSIFQRTRDMRLMNLSGSVTESGLEPSVRAMFAELASAERYGFSAYELAEALRTASASHERSWGPNAMVGAENLAYALTQAFLTGTPYPDRASRYAWVKEHLSGITLQEVNDWARTHRGPRGWSILLAAPPGAGTPTIDDVRGWANAASLDPPGRPPARKNRPILVNNVKRGAVTTTSYDQALDATTWQLSNGIRVVVKPVKQMSRSVLIHGLAPGGTARLSDSDFIQAHFADVIAGASGAGPYDAREIQQALIEADSSVAVRMSQLWRTISIDTNASGLETALKVAHLRLTHPQLSREVFAEWKTRWRDYTRRQDGTAETKFWATVGALTNEDEPRALSLTSADIERTAPEKAFSIWQQQLAGFAGTTFFVVGDVDSVPLRHLVETYLGSLPAGDKVLPSKPPQLQYPSSQIDRTIATGTAPRAKVLLQFMAADQFSVNLENDVEIFEEVLRARLWEVLRGALGSVYTPRVWAWAAREPQERHGLRILFDCAPENVEPLTNGVFTELRALARVGVGAEYLEPVKVQLQRRHSERRSTANWLLETLARVYLYHDPLSSIADPEFVAKSRS